MLFRQRDISTYSVLTQQPDSEAVPPLLYFPLTFYVFITNDRFYNYTKYPSIKSSTDTNITADSGNTLLFSGVDSSTGSAFLAVTQVTKPPPLSFQNRRLFGIISITPPKVFCNYILTLEANAIKWRYYIIADKSIMDLDVKEKGKDSPGNGSEIITFTDVNSAIQTDAVYEAIKTSFPDAGVFVKESNTEVPLTQRPGKIIQCWNATDKKHELLLLDNLPVPSCIENGQKIIHILRKNNAF
jgi:hypothetical protein